MAETFYDVLGVSPDASQAAIREAYREKAKAYHPDVSDREDATKRFKRVKRAEEVLGDPSERDRYDRLGHAAYVGDAGGDDGSTDAGGDDVSTDSGGDMASGAGTRGRTEREPTNASQSTTIGNGGRGPDGGGGATSCDDGIHGDGATEATASNDAAWEDVRRAAASAAGGSADAEGGGRSAGWREHERHHRGTAGWDVGRTGADDDGASETGESGSADPRSSTAGGRTGSGVEPGASSDSERGADYAVRNRTNGGSRSSSGPDWTRRDLGLLASTGVVYPILLWSTVLPPYPLAARIVFGVAAVATATYLVTRPSIALVVFGAWSLLTPTLLVGFGVPLLSLTGAVFLLGTGIPLLYAVIVWAFLRA